MSERFNLAAQVLLTRRLKNLLRIDEVVEVDMSYVTCAEYQLFINAQQIKNKQVQPDHWGADRFPLGMAKYPIMGVRASDAEAFCDWLTQQKFTPGFRYRLPSPSEVYSYSTAEKEIGCWCQEGAHYTVASIEPHQWHRWQGQLQKQLKVNVGLYGETGSFFPNPVHDVGKALDFANAPDVILTSAIAIASAIASARDLAIALNRARALARALDRARNLDLTRDLDLDLNRARNRALALARNLARAFALDLDRDLARARDLAFDLAHDLAIALDLDLDLDLARDLALARDLDLDITVINAHDRVQDLGVFRDYLLGTYVYLNFLLTSHHQAPKKGSFLKRLEFTQTRDNTKIQKYIDLWHEAGQLYCHFALIELRREGKMPVWEGIRIVRERIDL